MGLLGWVPYLQKFLTSPWQWSSSWLRQQLQFLRWQPQPGDGVRAAFSSDEDLHSKMIDTFNWYFLIKEQILWTLGQSVYIWCLRCLKCLREFGVLQNKTLPCDSNLKSKIDFSLWFFSSSMLESYNFTEVVKIDGH